MLRTCPQTQLIRFSDDFGGETNMYQGYDLNVEARFRNGAFLKGGIAAGARARSTTATSSPLGLDAVTVLTAGLPTAQGTEIYPDGIERLPSRVPLPA